MLIPSIDLLGGQIVQLVQGEKLRLAFDDFEYWIEKFSKYPLVQLIDLDAAKRQGDNRALVEQMAKRLRCQVGGGINTVERARQMLEAGARRVIIGSALFTGEGKVNTEFAAELAGAIRAEQMCIRDSHTVEDVGIALGEAFDRALGDKRGILRAGYFLMPMDETLAVAAVDLSGRAAFAVDTKVKTRLVGDLLSLIHI